MPCTVSAENAVRRLFKVAVRVIAYVRNDLFGVVAWEIAFQLADKAPLALGVACHISVIIGSLRNGDSARYHSIFTHYLGSGELAAHSPDISHRPACTVGGHFQTKTVEGFKQYALSAFQTHSQRPVRRLTEISALGVLYVRPACHKGHLHVRKRGVCENSRESRGFQQRYDQPLPVLPQYVLGAVGGKYQSAALLKRLQQQMYLRIMAQRLIVTYAHSGSGDCLLVCYAAMVKIRINAESLRYQRAEYLQLNLAHEPQIYLAQLFVPYHMELGVFLFKQTHFVKHIVGVNVSGKQHTVGENRLDNRVVRFAFSAQPLPRKGVRKTRHSAKRACGSFIHSAELCARIYPYLVHLALAHSVLYTQNAAGYLHVSEPCPTLRGYLIYPCAEIGAVFGH